VLELPPELLGRATVVVEDPATASREAGEVIAAVERRLLRTADLVPLADLAAGRALVRDDRPRVFKSVGMAWEDRVVAEAILTAHRTGQGATDD
jgi:ornithine cyclodeaminase